MDAIDTKIFYLTYRLNLIDAEEPTLRVWSIANYSSFVKTRLWKNWESAIIEHFNFTLIDKKWDVNDRKQVKIMTYKTNDDIYLQIWFIPAGKETRFKIKMWEDEDEDEDLSAISDSLFQSSSLNE